MTVRQRKRDMADWRVVSAVASSMLGLVSLPQATHQITHQILVILALRERVDTTAMRFSTNQAMEV